MGFFGKLLLWGFFGNLFWYLVGSFIAFDLNPANWWLIDSTFGRVLLVFFEMFIFGISIKAAEDV